ncbi:hypothetical protein ACFYO9_22190 [Streptomyces sp. NPDC005863]|uniref:hypothetical protein n=1 Tax=unclassified Streptomyces TaxID=2593676 RepID=UPI003409CA45
MARLVRCGPEGDTPAGLSAADLVGSWRGDPLGTLRLAADGTFTAEDWPVLEDFEKISKTTKGISGKGTWSVERGMGDDKDDRDLDLQFDFTGELPDGLLNGYDIAGEKDSLRVYTYSGDPDLCEFHTLTPA